MPCDAEAVVQKLCMPSLGIEGGCCLFSVGDLVRQSSNQSESNTDIAVRGS